MTPEGFDWLAPDYTAVFNARMRRLAWIREDPDNRLPPLKAFYREYPTKFIGDWGVTFDPRNADVDIPTLVPFLLFPKQEEWCEWVLDSWRKRRHGLTEKSRDCGVSWLAIALSCSLCLFRDGMVIGFGSRKEEYVDKIDGPKSLFYKARKFMEYLPPEFRGGFNPRVHAPHMRMSFPDTGSHLAGEAGNNIGRGDRAAIYFFDEAAHHEQPVLVDASLSATTNCRMDVSSVNGPANPFAQKRFSWPSEQIFVFDWRDDPRKSQEWYDKLAAPGGLDPVTLAQEVDRDYNASQQGVLIPSAWVQASIDAHLKLGIAPVGGRTGGFDVADEGKDALALALLNGWYLEELHEWYGKGDDIFSSVEKVFMLCDDFGAPGFKYDSDGLGVGVRGDARVINATRLGAGRHMLDVRPFRGSAEVYDPEGFVDPREKTNPDRNPLLARRNKDFFVNCKAQSWWSLRRRFEATFRAVTESAPYNPDDLISLSGRLPLLGKLTGELSQPTYDLRNGKILIEKTPDGSKSPNLADAVMIAYSRTSREPMRIRAGVAGDIK